MSLPIGTICEFIVHRAELKRSLPGKPAENGKQALPPKAVVKLGLEAPDGSKGYAEMFCDEDANTWPGEGQKLTLILDPPKQEGWLPRAKRPRSGGGGFRGRSPADTKAIQRQHSQEMGIRVAVAAGYFKGEVTPGHLDNLKTLIDWFEADIANG